MHVDPDVLSLAALGERLDPTDLAHLDGCMACRDQVEALRRVVDLGREAGLAHLDEPPAELWTRIRDELGLRDDLGPAGRTAGSPVSAGSADTLPPPPAPASTAGHGDRAGLDVGAVDPESRATASVTLSVDGHGRRILQLVLEADRPAPGLRHAWLARHDDPARRELLGMLDGRFGVWTIDQAIDLSVYSVLEVSQRGEDGTDRPIVRGDLAAIA